MHNDYDLSENLRKTRIEMAEGKQKKKRIANQALDVELLINSEVKFELPEFKDWTLLLSIPLRVFLKKSSFNKRSCRFNGPISTKIETSNSAF